MTEAVIVDAIRTPVGVLGGRLSSIRPDDMAALVIREIVQRNDLDPALVEEMAAKVRTVVGTDGEGMKALEYLETVLRDFVHLTSGQAAAK